MGDKPSAVEESVKSRDDGERVNSAVDDGEGEPGPGHAAGKKSDDSCVRNRTLVLKGHTETVHCLVALADGRLASGSGDTSIIIWNLRGELIPHDPRGHPSTPNDPQHCSAPETTLSCHPPD